MTWNCIIKYTTTQLVSISFDYDMPICETCRTTIEFLPYRIVFLENKDLEIDEFDFHYFSPCWSIDDFFQFHEDEKIVSLGYSYDRSILNRPMVFRNLKNNMDLWL